MLPAALVVPLVLGVPPLALVPPALVVPVAVPAELTPVAEVLTTGEGLDGVVVAGVEVEPVELERPEPVGAPDADELLEASGELSSALLVTGSSAVGLAGTLSVTVVPPQAPSATVAAAAPSRVSERLPRVTRSPAERAHAAPAGGAIVEVALSQLVTPRADTQVLNRPRKL